MTWWTKAAEELQKAESLPEAVLILSNAAGSHDKLAVAIKDELGESELNPSRQTVIRWIKGGRPSPPYRDVLQRFGVPAGLLRPSRKDVERRLRQIEAEVAAIRNEL